MPTTSAATTAFKPADPWPMGELARRAADRDEAAIRAIMRRYNPRLFRLARSILLDADEAEDAVQQGYIQAFAHIGKFRGDADLGTWLARIVINVALDLRRRSRHLASLPPDLDAAINTAAPRISLSVEGVDPERSVAQHEIGVQLEKAIDALPQAFRTVLVARVIEQLSVEETATLLGIPAETAKTRLHRARSLLRDALRDGDESALTGVFPFDGWRCDRLINKVMKAIGVSSPTE